MLMGSLYVPLPLAYGEVMINNWEIIGHFMYSPDVFRRILSLVRAGLLDLNAIKTKTFPLADLPAAIGGCRFGRPRSNARETWLEGCDNSSRRSP